MLKKIWLNFIFIIFISGNNLPLISSLNNEDVNQNSNLTIDYLNDLYEFLEQDHIQKFTFVDARLKNQIILNE